LLRLEIFQNAFEVRMRLAGAIKQLLDPRLLISNDKSGSKCAAAALLFRQSSCVTIDDIYEECFVRHDVVGLA